jgi:uncharacterized protein YjbJ (UPF0337 family)
MSTEDKAAGKTKEWIGKATDDEDLEREGRVEHAEGKVSGAVEDAKEKVEEASDAAKGAWRAAKDAAEDAAEDE